MPSEAGLSTRDLVEWTRIAPEAALADVCARLCENLDARRVAVLLPSRPGRLPAVVASAGIGPSEVAEWLAGPAAPSRMELRCHGRTTGHLVTDGDEAAPTGDAEALCAAAAWLLASYGHGARGHLLEPLGADTDAAVPPVLVNPGRFVLARDLPREGILAAAESPPAYGSGTRHTDERPDEGEGLFDALLALVPGLALALEGPELRVVGASPMLEAQLGRAARPGMRLEDLLPDMPADVVAALRQAAGRGAIPERLEHLAARTLASETGGTWSVGLRPFRRADGEPRGVLVFGVGSAGGGTPGGLPDGAQTGPDLFEMCPTPLMMIALPELRVVRYNAAMGTILEGVPGWDGRPEGVRIEDFVAPSVWEQAGPAFRQLLATGQPVHLAELRATLAGLRPEERYFNWTLGLVRGPNGEPTHLLASALEVTAEVRHRKRQADALLAAETLAGDLRRALDEVRQPLALFRRPDRPEWRNSAFALRESELPGAWPDLVARALEGSEASSHGDDISVTVLPLPDARGAAALLTVAGPSRGAEAAAIRRSTALEAVLASLTDGVVICDASGDTLLVNPAMCRLLGVSGLPRDRAQRTAMMHPRDLQGVPLPPERTGVGLALAGHPPSGMRWLARRADGQDRVMESGASVIRDGDGRIAGCAVVVRDVTHHQRMTEERDDFISVAAHELRTPLTALLLEVQLLSRIAAREGIPEGWGPHLQRLHTSAGRMKSLVDGLLDVARLERGAVTIQPESLDLGAVTEQEVRRLADLYPTHPVVLRRHQAPPVRADRLRLEQVLANLVDNAVKYCPPGTPIEVDLTAEGGQAVLRVRDHGPGLQGPELSSLFTRYFRGEGHGPRKHPGLGLGLFISRQIAALHGGTISAANHVEGGLEVTLRLPLAVPPE